MCPSRHGRPTPGRRLSGLIPALFALCALIPSAAGAGMPGGFCVVDGALICGEGTDATWRKLDGENIVGYVRSDSRVYAGTSRGVFAFALDSGRLLWRAARAEHAFTPVSVGGQVWVGTRSGQLLALDERTGLVRQRIAFGGWVYSPAVAGDRLIVTTRSRRVHAISASTGEHLWQRPLPQEPVGPAVLIGGNTAVVATYARTLNAFAVAGGTPRWTRPVTSLPRQLRGTENRLFYLGFDGSIAAHGATDGARLWTGTPEPRAVRIGLGSEGIRAWLEDGRLVAYRGNGGKTAPLKLPVTRAVAADLGRGVAENGEIVNLTGAVAARPDNPEAR